MAGPTPFVPEPVRVLTPFVDAGVLGAGEVHLAAAVARLCPGNDPLVLLAVAVAARAPSLGHVGVELAAVPERVLDRFEEVVTQLPWPITEEWAAALATSAAVAAPADAHREPLAPLVWDGERIYLQRYWAYESLVAEDIARRAGPGPASPAIDAAIAELFPTVVGADVDLQRLAASVALGHRLSVIAGGPGTGKTRTIARLLAAAQQAAAADGHSIEVALAAPTGKAAARMTEAVHQAVAEALAEGVIDAGLAERVATTEASTIHALLGWGPGVRFRHDRENPLTHDLVIIDETSMVSLPLMARLLQAVRPDASLVLVGDPDQLASVDAGTVLADLVGERGPDPLASGLPLAPRRRRSAPPAEDPAAPRLFDLDELDAGPGQEPAPLAVAPPPATAPAVAVAASSSLATTSSTAPLAGLVTVLERVHRFGVESGIAALADAVRRGDADAALTLLDGSRPDLVWVRSEDRSAQATVEATVVGAAVDVTRAALAGDARAGLAAALRVKVLAATRHGEGGLYDWTARIEAAVRVEVPELDRAGRWYAGRPVLVTANDRVNKLANGDVGLVVAQGTGTVVALPQGDDLRYVPVSRLHEAETWWAMTIHKSQGSEFPHVVVSLPGVRSPILTRELLYTAITRAKEQVTLVAGEDALRLAIGRPVARASGLGARLWPS